MKELFLIRHAKSSWKDINLADFERPLNKRGMSDAPMMGELMFKNRIIPDLIVSSPALRAKTTAEIIAQKINYTAEIVLDEEIYEASTNALLQIINRVNDDVQTLFVLGHNPGFTYLAELLSNQHFGNIPTCGIVGIRFDFESWNLLSSDTGEVFLYEYPKKYK